MTFDADSLAERRRLKRRVSHWRIAAILAFALLILILGARNGNFLTSAFPKDQIARITIEGFIADNREQRKLLKKIADAKQVKGVIVFINSPGGTTAGAEGLFFALRKLSEKKPTVAVFGTIATSAAYLAGISTDHIVARGNSITGSVGVIVQWAEVSDLLKSWGVRFEEVRSGSLKAVPSPFTATDAEGRKLVEQLVNESRDWFVQLVKERRNLNNNALGEIRTGRVYTGRQALPIGLIDEIGDEDTARAWLEEKRNIPKDLAVVDWKIEESSGWLSLTGAANGTGDLLGTVFYRAGQKLMNNYNHNNLDGLNSVWHPQQQQ